MTVALRPMRADEFDTWVPEMRDNYARDMVENGGMTEEDARAKAHADVERLFPGGRLNDEQLVSVVEDDGEPVGYLWLCQRDDAFTRGLFVYEIRIGAEHRGKGYGKAAMLLAEEEARERGIGRIALNVFGGNQVARNLYLSLGYDENAVAMSKTL